MSTKRPNSDIGDLLSLHVLELLYRKPRHGYEIMEELARHVGVPSRPGTVYPFLKKLKGRGYIDYDVERVGRRPRKVYQLTAEGRRLCASFFRQFSSLIDAAVEPRLKTCPQCGCKLYEGGHTEIVRGQKLFFCCRYCAGSYKVARRRR